MRGSEQGIRHALIGTTCQALNIVMVVIFSKKSDTMTEIHSIQKTNFCAFSLLARFFSNRYYFNQSIFLNTHICYFFQLLFIPALRIIGPRIKHLRNYARSLDSYSKIIYNLLFTKVRSDQARLGQ